MIRNYLLSLLVFVNVLSCTNEIKYKDHRNELIPARFIKIENSQFTKDGKEFFPLIMNYMITLRQIKEGIVISPTLEYDYPSVFEGETIDSVCNRIAAHFKTIKQMGFNSIRVLGFDVFDYTTNGIAFNSFSGLNRTKLNYKENYENYIKALRRFVNIAEINGLNLIILFPRPQLDKYKNSLRLEFIEDFLTEFSENPTIYAYDFMNEPLYFDNSEISNHGDRRREKLDVYRMVSNWNLIMDKNAPFQLMTISYAEPSEVFEWDPKLLPVDFVSIHSYSPLRVPNEIYWYSKYIDRPWVISETALPADNDSISYEAQAQFMKDAFQRAINCGAAGLGWWQYQDVYWGPFEHNFSALVNSKGKTTLDDDKTVIYGTLKDAAFVLPNLKLKKNGKCECHVNYYNMMGYHNYKIKGKVLSEGKPVEGAVVRAWNKYWGIGLNTFSNKKGEFTIYSNDKCVHFEISAPGLSHTKFSREIEYQLSEKHESDIKLKDVNLEYHSIHYERYLKEVNSSIFDFDSSLYGNAIYEAEIEPINLNYLLPK